MNRITCEMCGSNRIIKKNGVYECQYCGCQYTLEEARKLLVEGTVKIDESEKVGNWVKLADSAFDNSNWKEAYLYYCKILEAYPEEWRATYRKAMTIGWQSSLGNIHINETLGGITDALKILIHSDNTDQYKALGIVSMEKDLLTWVNAVQLASVQHARQFTDRLIEACDEYYQRSVLMASAIEYCINMFDKYAVMNIDEVNLADNVYDGIISNSNSIKTALCEEFRVYIGKKYSSFWQASIDEYRNITPPEYASKAYSDLEMAIRKLKRTYCIWKYERVEEDKTRKLQKYWEKSPEIKEVYETLEEQYKILGEQIRDSKMKLGINKDELERTVQNITDTKETLAINNNRIEKLAKRWTGKKQAIEEIRIIEKDNDMLKESLEKLNSKREKLEEIIATGEKRLETDEKRLESMKDRVNEVMTSALSS